MKKILTVWDGKRWSQGSLALSCYLSRLSHSRLTGIFPGPARMEEQPVTAAVNEHALHSSKNRTVLSGAQDLQSVDEAKDQFHVACQQQGVPYTAHRNIIDAESELITESVFADVMIVDESTSFSAADLQVPSRLVRSLLSGAKCPVIIAPEAFEDIGEIILAYDGSPSSVYAIKQFAYLFPELRDRRITVVEVSDRGLVDEYFRLEEWLDNYYSEVTYEVLEGDAEERLFEFVLARQQAFLVMGAFGRGALSSFFRPSTAEAIVRYANFPVFITHH